MGGRIWYCELYVNCLILFIPLALQKRCRCSSMIEMDFRVVDVGLVVVSLLDRRLENFLGGLFCYNTLRNTMTEQPAKESLETKNITDLCLAKTSEL